MNTNNESIKVRVKELIAEYSNGVSDFAKKIGTHQSTLSRALSENGTFGEGLINKIVIACNISKQWIETGRGTKTTAPDASETIQEAEAIAVQNIPTVMSVPLVNQYAYAGYLSGFQDDTYLRQLPTIPFIADHEAKGKYVAFEVKGDSMNDGSEDSYLEGDKVLCREIAPDLWATSKLHIRKWDFIIVHKDGILLKRIVNHDVTTHTIRIHSLNPMYRDQDVNLAEVHQIFNIIEIQRSKRR